MCVQHVCVRVCVCVCVRMVCCVFVHNLMCKCVRYMQIYCGKKTSSIHIQYSMYVNVKTYVRVRVLYVVRQRVRESRAPESVSQRDRANEEGGVRGLGGGDEFISNVLLPVYAYMDVLCLYSHTFIYSTYIICIHMCKYEYLHTQIHRKTSIGIYVHRCVHVYKCVSMCTHKEQRVTHLQAINVHKYIKYVYTVCCSGQRTSIKQER